MMWQPKVLLVLGVLLRSGSSYKLLPGIFDPNPFIPKMNAELVQAAQADDYQAPQAYGSAGGAKDGEVGFVRSFSEKGNGGYLHKENYHSKDGKDFAHEKQIGFGESKNDLSQDGKQESKARSDESTNLEPEEEEREYEVTEDNFGDEEDPNQYTTYVAPTKHKKKPQFYLGYDSLKLPKKTTLKKNENGYETTVYHENESESSEKGYDTRKSHDPLQKSVAINQKIQDSPIVPEEDEPVEEDRDDERSEYGDEYGSFRFDDDFSRDYKSNDDNANEEEKKSDKNNTDYDEEVDQDVVDESADEDRYHGFEYENDNEEAGDDAKQPEQATDGENDGQ